MPIEHRQEGDVTVVQLSGRLDSAVSGDVMDQLNALVNAGTTKLILNLKELTYISSAGLRSILVAAKLVKSANGEMRLCEPNGRVSKVLDESGFGYLIKIDSHEGQSLAAFRGEDGGSR
jgi:anti-anti-sigma factor